MILMKRIRQTRKNNFVSIIEGIYNHFGTNTFFTFCPFKDNRLSQQSTFGRDNSDKLYTYLPMMQAKLFSGSIDTIIAAIRIFLPDKITVDGPKGKIEIPRKDIYHFGFTKDEIVLFDENETYDSQNTDAFTGDILEHEEGLIYRSSIELYNFLVTLNKSDDNKEDDELLEPLVINLEDLFNEPAPEEFTKLKERALSCTTPEEAFKLEHEFRKWSPDRFDVAEYESVLLNYQEALDTIYQIVDEFITYHNIDRNKYRDVTYTQPKHLDSMIQRYQGSEIIEIGSVKILTWKKKKKRRSALQAAIVHRAASDNNLHNLKNSDEERKEMHMIREKIEKREVLEEVRIYDNKIDEVAEKISNKLNIPKAKAEAILKIGIFEGLMMNRYRNIDLEGKGERE